jgi:hypothetical protein
MIEKLGHSKRIQVMRRQWIDEGKEKRCYNGDSNERPFQEAFANTLRGEHLDVANRLSEEARDTETSNDVNSEQLQSVLDINNGNAAAFRELVPMRDAKTFVASEGVEEDEGEREVP